MSGASLQGVRGANLAAVLRLVHVQGPLSRAELTTQTGLNRSTIGALVSALVDAGLVGESDPAGARKVGRPSPVVAVDPDVVAIAANPEVDAVTVAAVRLDQSIVARVRIERDHLVTPDETARLIGDQVRAWRRGPLRNARTVAVGVAVPGPVRAADGLVREAPHLGWRDAALAPLVQHATGLPAVIGNDADMGAVAEHLFGAARGVADVVYLNGGASGIGGGIIAGGMLLRGAGGYTGEFGQNRPAVAHEDDRRSPHGVLEDEVSRARLLAAAGLRAADDAELAAALLGAGATASSAGRRADAGADDPRADAASDPARRDAASDEVARQRRILATALANAVNALNPSVVVLGGFLATLAAADLPALRADVRAQAMPACAEDLDIRPATLADDRLLIGAAEAAFAGLLHDPLGSG
ncbi:ROK family protein [Microbacterium sp.]|uniref:ROK family protein n=1 Tax=Microbacterium sp. TaxID=51671 RepID=UPI003A8D47E5